MLTGDLQGIWWLPNSPSTTVSGTLSLSYTTHPTLLVVGAIDPTLDVVAAITTTLGRTRALPLVFGRTASGQAVTLSDVRLAVREMHIENPESAVFELVAHTAFIGSLLDPDKTVFETMDLEVERLADWGRVSPFRINVSAQVEARDRIELIGELPPRLAVPIEGGEFSVTTSVSPSGDMRRQAILTERTSLRIRLEEPLNPEQWFEGYVWPLVRLIALATGRPVDAERLDLQGPGGELSCEVVWAHELRSSEPDRGLLEDEILFSLPDLGDDLPAHLRLWFVASVRFKPVLDMFFATRYAKQMFEEDRFQNLIQAVEAYHRRTAGARPNQSEHETRTVEILATVLAEHRNWLEEVLRTSKEYLLADRVEALADQHPWMTGSVLPLNIHDWAVGVAKARNQRAHHDPRSPKIGSSVDELMSLTQRLTVILEASLLRELGFDEARIEQMITHGSQAARILQLNPRLRTN